MRKRPQVAILGATGHVGKVLAAELADRFTLTLYARRPEAVWAFVASESLRTSVEVCTHSQFGSKAHDVIISCLGIGDPGALVGLGSGILTLTEEFDRLTLEYIGAYPDSRLISFSSGAVYGSAFADPVDESCRAEFSADRLGTRGLYGIAKLVSEAKHRAASDESIVDLRLFGLFSRYINLSARYLMSDIVRAIIQRTTLVTSRQDVVRDYVDPSDLADLVSVIIEADPLNDVLDVYSAEPVAKFTLLDHFAERYGLTYVVSPDADVSSPTGDKLNYYSTNRRAAVLGYIPSYTSLESVTRETDAILLQGRNL